LHVCALFELHCEILDPEGNNHFGQADMHVWDWLLFPQKFWVNIFPKSGGYATWEKHFAEPEKKNRKQKKHRKRIKKNTCTVGNVILRQVKFFLTLFFGHSPGANLKRFSKDISSHSMCVCVCVCVCLPYIPVRNYRKCPTSRKSSPKGQRDTQRHIHAFHS